MGFTCKTFLAAGAVLLAVAPALSQTAPKCIAKLQDYDGSEYDFTSLMSTTDLTYTDDDNNKFYFRLCGDTSETCIIPGGGPIVGMGILVPEPQGTVGAQCVTLGTWDNEAAWQPQIGTDGKQLGVTLIASNGGECQGAADAASLQVNINCYTDDQNTVKASRHPKDLLFHASVDETGCQGTYTIESCLACHGGCSDDGGLSGGAVFAIVLFCGILPIVIIGGIVINRFVLHETGTANLYFWRGYARMFSRGSSSSQSGTGTGAKYEDFGRATYGTDTL